MGATYFKNALSVTRNILDIDWKALERAWAALPERNNDEEDKSAIEWHRSNNVRSVQGATGDSARTEVISIDGDEKRDFAKLKHGGVSGK